MNCFSQLYAPAIGPVATLGAASYCLGAGAGRAFLGSASGWLVGWAMTPAGLAPRRVFHQLQFGKRSPGKYQPAAVVAFSLVQLKASFGVADALAMTDQNGRLSRLGAAYSEPEILELLIGPSANGSLGDEIILRSGSKALIELRLECASDFRMRDAANNAQPGRKGSHIVRQIGSKAAKRRACPALKFGFGVHRLLRVVSYPHCHAVSMKSTVTSTPAAVLDRKGLPTDRVFHKLELGQGPPGIGGASLACFVANGQPKATLRIAGPVGRCQQYCCHTGLGTAHGESELPELVVGPTAQYSLRFEVFLRSSPKVLIEASRQGATDFLVHDRTDRLKCGGASLKVRGEFFGDPAERRADALVQVQVMFHGLPES